MSAPDDGEKPPVRWRTFVARRLDRRRHWIVRTDAEDDELVEVLREAGYDPATRSPGQDCAPPEPDERDDSSLTGRRWVRIMAEVCTDCVWNIAGEGCLADGLPVSAVLRQRMFTWQDWYDRDYDEEDGPFDRVAFAAEGLAIARAVKAELPGWTVIYHDESRTGDYRGPRSVFEYEVFLPEASG